MVDQRFGGGRNLQDESRFDAIGEQLNFFEGQEAVGQRHRYTSLRVRKWRSRSGQRRQRVPKRMSKVQITARHDNTIKCYFFIRRDMTCKYFLIARQVRPPAANLSEPNLSGTRVLLLSRFGKGWGQKSPRAS